MQQALTDKRAFCGIGRKKSVWYIEYPSDYQPKMDELHPDTRQRIHNKIHKPQFPCYGLSDNDLDTDIWKERLYPDKNKTQLNPSIFCFGMLYQAVRSDNLGAGFYWVVDSKDKNRRGDHPMWYNNCSVRKRYEGGSFNVRPHPCRCKASKRKGSKATCEFNQCNGGGMISPKVGWAVNLLH